MSDVPTLQWLVDWANVGIVAALVASLVFGAASIVFSKRLNTLKDEQATRDKQASDERIAAANEGAAKANREASRVENEGKERVAKVEADAQKEIARLTTEADKARANIATAQTDAAQANERTQRLAIEAAEARRRQAEAERALLELQQQIKPRHFTANQEAIFLETLRAYPVGKIQIEFTEADFEAESFAKELLVLLGKAGWEVSLGGFLRPNVGKGITIGVQDAQSPPARAVGLAKALNEAGFKFQFHSWGFTDADKDLLWLDIGARL